ncbi:MAG: anthranilate phosphoribosyltransferase [Candidatus Altiarchaeota archaeon]|nr:anthranilate phosphoribosyltransferase [Candidatus Altiarchaeota archaeon]
MKDIVSNVVSGKDLTSEEAEKALKAIMSGESNDIEIAAFLTGLKMKGETAEEIAAFAKVMRRFAVKINPKVSGTLVDMCGTGGDRSNTFNISTTAMFIVAGAGITVAKHGNRAMTSKCGSADVLECLGIDLSTQPEKIQKCIEDVGIGFMFAPMHHSATKHVMPVRKALGYRTVFNMLGPLTNPANAKAQLMGIYEPGLTEKIAEVFRILGLEKAMVVHGEPGIDELSTLGRTKVSELKDNKVNTYYITPEKLGLKKAEIKDLLGGRPETNAKILSDILKGEDKGPKRDIAVLNAAGGIVVGGEAEDLAEGIEIAKEALDSGKAYGKLTEYIEYNRKK